MIILLGFPKSGTTSFQELFKNLGYKTIHWTCKKKYIGTIIKQNKLNKLPLLHGFENIDCVTQMDVCISDEHCYWPQIIDYKQLYKENMQCIFILNQRDPLKIINSFSRWNNMNERLYKFNPELIAPFNGDTNDEKLIQLINAHYANVISFFNSKPKAKFIVFDIDNDNVNKLSKYINIKNQQFPHCNKNKNKNKNIKI